MVAEKIAKLLNDCKGDPEITLKELREARGFLKDNNVTAEVGEGNPLRKIEQEVVKTAELPFEVSNAE